MLSVADEGSLAAGGAGGLCGAEDDMFSMACLPSFVIKAGRISSYRLLMRHVTGVGHRGPQCFAAFCSHS